MGSWVNGPAVSVGPDKRGEVLRRDADRVLDPHVGEPAGVAERVDGRRADAEAVRGLAHGQEPTIIGSSRPNYRRLRLGPL
jgi:hypothetical protein